MPEDCEKNHLIYIEFNRSQPSSWQTQDSGTTEK